MKKLEELLAATAVKGKVGNTDIRITGLGFDSRAVEDGMLFFALVGTQSDGHDYIEAAVKAGASAVVCQRMPQTLHENVAYVEVEDSTAAMADIAAEFYNHPSEKLRLVGITGTNGKTTTATLLYNLFRTLGYKVGLISTVIYAVHDKTEPSTHTTPDTIRLNRMMAEMADAGCEYCFMEVSSHSIVQQRIRGLHFAGAVFSNITLDHLDYHKTFAEYIKAKKGLFDSLTPDAFAVINIDDKNGRVMVQNCRARVRTLSLRSMADYRLKIVEMLPEGMQLSIDGTEVWVGFTGRFNAYNLLSVYAVARELGADKQQTLTAMSTLPAVDGRFQTLQSQSGITAIVDYAHTPDALQNVIDTINEIRRPQQKLFIVVGCGGDRDASKRPVMGRIAAAGGDMAVLTSDNPRTENPETILEQVCAELTPADKYIKVTDRAQAIRTAVMMAGSGDIILVAGKGHETYQIIGTEKHHFDDRQQIAECFAAKDGK